MTQYQEKIVGKPGGLVEPGVKQYGFLKKIFKKVKKVAKSPLGKLGIGALALGIPWGGGGTGGIGGLFGSKSGFGRGIGFLRNRMAGKAATGFLRSGAAGAASLGKPAGALAGANPSLWNRLKGGVKDFGYGKAALLGAGALGTALPFMTGGDEEDEIIDDWSVTPSSIANIRKMARARDPSLAFLPPAESVMSGYYGSKDGGIVGLANGGNPAEAQAEQMLKMEYQKYRNQGGTMSYQQFKMAVLQQAQGQGPMAQGQEAPMAQPQMAAHGGRIGLKWGGGPDEPAEDSEDIFEFMQDQGVSSGEQVQGNAFQMRIQELIGKGLSWDDAYDIAEMEFQDDFAEAPMAQGQPQMAAYGGRMGYQGGELVEDESMVEETPTGMMEENVEEVRGEPTREQMEALAMEIFQLRLEELDEEQLMVVYQAAMEQQPREEMMQEEDIQFDPQMAQGQMAQPQMAAEGGIMNLGGMEKDYRAEGGFVPIGGKEKADDVPARLSKNEFVFTADAVRNAGGGDIDAGAEVMENMMNNLEAGGQISEESQGGGEEMISEEEISEGPGGAQEMYDQQQMLQSRMA
jgi:hypothetical protein